MRSLIFIPIIPIYIRKYIMVNSIKTIFFKIESTCIIFIYPIF
nr:MAG TPA: hypothetical protein [Bacteriophage sp.]